MTGALRGGSGIQMRRLGRRLLAVVRSEHEALFTSACAQDPERYLREQGMPAGGRGLVARVPAGPAPDPAAPSPAAAGALIMKKYRRGGLLSGFLPDLFLGCGRMLADFEASERAREHGVPCGIAAGLILRRAWGPVWAGYLLSEEIAGAETLDRALTAADPAAALGLAARAVRSVRRLHDAGILHRDLNLRNLLTNGSEVFVIDLDGAAMPRTMTARRRFSNLSRLDRSYVKLFGERGPLAHGDRRALLAEYCAGDQALLGAFTQRLAAHKRRLALHALSWSMRGRSLHHP